MDADKIRVPGICCLVDKSSEAGRHVSAKYPRHEHIATPHLSAAYHDDEWGVPLHEDRALFEFLILEGAQAGLSWVTILRKRAHYRVVFDGFDPQVIARYDDAKIAALLGDPGIIRNRAKIAAAIGNARAFLAVQEEFQAFGGNDRGGNGFNAYLWRFSDGTAIQNNWRTAAEVPVRTVLSDALSKDLKRRGFSFVGSTICYSLMQAVGMVNDHLIDCYRHRELGSHSRWR